MEHINMCPVLRPAHGRDCTNNGLSSRLDYVTVVKDVPYIMTHWNGNTYYERPDEVAVRKYCHKKKINEATVLILCDKTNNPTYTPYLKPIEDVWNPKGKNHKLGPMMGGNYVIVREGNEYYTNEKVVRVHDRYETQEENDTLSR